MFGYRPEPMLNLHMVILGGQKPDVLGMIRKGEPFNGEIILRGKGGHPFPAHLRCAPLRDERDRPVAMVGVASHLTEEKEKERISGRIQ
jgi:hypothetical protein